MIIAAHDVLNAVFETAGSHFVAYDAWFIFRRKLVVGRPVTPMIFFTGWGISNLYVYPAASMPLSAIAAAMLCAMNLLVLVLIMIYRERRGDHS